MIPVGNEAGGGRCRDGVFVVIDANRARSLYELWTICVIQFILGKPSKRISNSDGRCKMGARDIDYVSAFVLVWRSPKLSRARSTRIYMYAELFFDAVSHFCPGFSNKAAAAVYNALVHAIPPRARARVHSCCFESPRAKAETGRVQRQFYIENESRLHKFIAEFRNFVLADQLANRWEQIDALWAQQRQINIAPVRLH